MKGAIAMNKNIEKIISSIDPLTKVADPDPTSVVADPLNDSAFKIALENYDDIFNKLVLYTTGKEVNDSIVNAVGSETSLIVKGKTMRFDHLRNTDIGYVNLEGHKKLSTFTIKRHFSHWSMIFSSQLQEGDDYKIVVPVTVIVFYKNRGKAKPLIQKANATGDLLDGVDTQYLNLISVNTAKWYEADNDDFKHYLALLHLGLDEEVLAKNGVDIADTSFQELRNKLMYCCAEHAMNKAKKKGDKDMSKMLSVYLTEKGMKKGMEKGMEKGIEKGAISVYHKEMQLTPEEISQKMNIPLNKVVETIKNLQTAM